MEEVVDYCPFKTLTDHLRRLDGIFDGFYVSPNDFVLNF